jgi:hypothetical protein
MHFSWTFRSLKKRTKLCLRMLRYDKQGHSAMSQTNSDTAPCPRQTEFHFSTCQSHSQMEKHFNSWYYFVLSSTLVKSCKYVMRFFPSIPFPRFWNICCCSVLLVLQVTVSVLVTRWLVSLECNHSYFSWTFLKTVNTGYSLFHRAFQFTIYNGPTNALVCIKTLIQMSQTKTFKITPTCFGHHMIIIRELSDPG